MQVQGEVTVAKLMSLPFLKCILFVFLFTTPYVSGSTKPLTNPNPSIEIPQSNQNLVNNGQLFRDTRPGTFGDLLASRTGYTVSEGGRSLGILTLALLIGIPIIIVVLVLIFLPIPMAIGRRTARMAQEVLQSDECVERVACEVLRFSRGMEYETEWLQRIFPNEDVSWNSKSWIDRVAKGARTPKCTKLACDPVGSLTKAIR